MTSEFKRDYGCFVTKLPLILTQENNIQKPPLSLPKILKPGIKITLLSESQKNKFNQIKEANKILVIEKLSDQEPKNNMRSCSYKNTYYNNTNNNTNNHIEEILNSSNSNSNYNFNNFINEIKPVNCKEPNLLFTKVEEDPKITLNKIAERLGNLGNLTNASIQNFLNSNYMKNKFGDSNSDKIGDIRLNLDNYYSQAGGLCFRSTSISLNPNLQSTNSLISDSNGKNNPIFIKKIEDISNNNFGHIVQNINHLDTYSKSANKTFKPNYKENIFAKKIKFLKLQKNKNMLSSNNTYSLENKNANLTTRDNKNITFVKINNKVDDLKKLGDSLYISNENDYKKINININKNNDNNIPIQNSFNMLTTIKKDFKGTKIDNFGILKREYDNLPEINAK